MRLIKWAERNLYDGNCLQKTGKKHLNQSSNVKEDQLFGVLAAWVRQKQQRQIISAILCF